MAISYPQSTKNMITDNNKKTGAVGNGLCLENGCRAVKLALYSNSNASFELRDGKMDRLQQASESGLSISLYVDGKYGSYSTNRLNKKELESFIKNGIDSTRYLAVDEARILPDTSVIIRVENLIYNYLTSGSKLSIRMIRWLSHVPPPRRFWAKTTALYP